MPLTLEFGVAVAWAIAKFDYRGRAVLITLIDLPFAVSLAAAFGCASLLAFLALVTLVIETVVERRYLKSRR